jgi:DNA mismatch endonuclease (patch repair protein)
MSGVRARNTKPELRVRRFLHARGLRYALHDRSLPGTPDLVFKSRRAVVFVHGCFWHQHAGCDRSRVPKTRTDYWSPKLRNNALRDKLNARRLRRAGWVVKVVWECDLSDKALESLFNALKRLPTTRVR